MAGSLPNGTAVYATILTYPFTAQGEALSPQPNKVLAKVSDFMNPFASSAFTVSQPTLSNNASRALYTRFVAAFIEANSILADPTRANWYVQL